MSAGRSPFAAAARAPLDQPLGNSGRWLVDGWYDGVIEDLDTTRAEETAQVTVVLRADSGGSHKEKVFVQNREGTGLSWTFLKLIGATLQSADAQREFRELLARGDTWRRVLEAFRGMRVRFSIDSNEGFRLVPNTEDMSYSAVLKDGTSVATAATAGEADRRAKALGHRKAFRNITEFEGIDVETTRLNLQAFSNAVASIKATSGTESTDDCDFDGCASTPPPDV